MSIVDKPVELILEQSQSKHKILDAVIVGSGFAGLCMGIQLRNAGYTNFRIFEKGSEVGGTWRENSYPGCACDVQSHLYCYSFEPNPDWSHVYSGWQEIQNYLIHCSNKYELRPHLQFETSITTATYSKQNKFWEIDTASGETFFARFFILATGALHIPQKPNIPGLADFKGSVFHSAEWDHSVSLAGKNVVSIGTGGSAIQYVPEIASQVDSLTVFQRSPAWVMPRNEKAYSKWTRTLFRKFNWTNKLYRSWLYLFNESRIVPMRRAWMVKLFESYARRFIRKQVTDKILQQALTPNYTIGCKRVLISNTYLKTFNKDNVTLNTAGIDHIETDKVIDKNGTRYPADTIILGTGFQADPRHYLKNINIFGEHEQELKSVWKHGAEGYLGITVKGFPNFFQLLGPNTLLGHNSVIYMIESQAEYIVNCLSMLKSKGASAMEIKEEYQVSFNLEVEERLNGSVWNSGCNSWYQQDSGKNFSIWPGATFLYRKKTRGISERHYHWS